MVKSKRGMRGFLIIPFVTKILTFIPETLILSTKARNGKSNIDISTVQSGLLYTGCCVHSPVALVDLELVPGVCPS